MKDQIFHWWGIAGLIVLSLLFLFRYEIIQAGTGELSVAAAYRLDHWTGEVRLIVNDKFRPVVPAQNLK